MNMSHECINTRLEGINMSLEGIDMSYGGIVIIGVKSIDNVHINPDNIIDYYNSIYKNVKSITHFNVKYVMKRNNEMIFIISITSNIDASEYIIPSITNPDLCIRDSYSFLILFLYLFYY